MQVSRHLFTFIATLTLSGVVLSQNSLDDPDIKQKVLDELPEIKGVNLTDDQIKSATTALQDKCTQNGGPGVFDKLKDSQEASKTCIEQYLNATAIQLELEEAKETGSMDEVFAKYCEKYPVIRQCLNEPTDLVKQCLDEKEKKAFASTMETVEEIKEFLCHKDGDRMAMFVAEGGPNCLNEKKEQIQICINQTLGGRVPTELTMETLPTFSFEDQNCSDFDQLGQCIVKELEKCKTNTPANIMDAFFKFLKKNTPCKDFQGVMQNVKTAKSINSAMMSVASLLTVVAAFSVKFIY